MKNFIPWVGGKSQLRKTILEYFPVEPVTRYIEVFGGGGWMLFSREQHAPTEIFNDIDGQLVNLYRCVKYHCEELQRELKVAEQVPLNSREQFFDYRAQLKQPGLTDIQRAARYYYIIRISYGADRHSYGCSKKTLDPIDDLPEIQRRLKKVVIENRDFEAILKAYDSAGSFFYLDPPYFKAEHFYMGFASEDHQRLYDGLKRVRGKWLLSYNNAPEIKNLYKEYNIIPVERANSLANKYESTKYKELIIKNY